MNPLVRDPRDRCSRDARVPCGTGAPMGSARVVAPSPTRSQAAEHVVPEGHRAGMPAFEVPGWLRRLRVDLRPRAASADHVAVAPRNRRRARRLAARRRVACRYRDLDVPRDQALRALPVRGLREAHDRRRAPACVAWPIVTRISSAPRWLFLRLAVLVTLVLFAPDVWISSRVSQAMPWRSSCACTSRSPSSPTTRSSGSQSPVPCACPTPAHARDAVRAHLDPLPRRWARGQNPVPPPRVVQESVKSGASRRKGRRLPSGSCCECRSREPDHEA